MRVTDIRQPIVPVKLYDSAKLAIFDAGFSGVDAMAIDPVVHGARTMEALQSCELGRDLSTFMALGHTAIGIASGVDANRFQSTAQLGQAIGSLWKTAGYFTQACGAPMTGFAVVTAGSLIQVMSASVYGDRNGGI